MISTFAMLATIVKRLLGAVGSGPPEETRAAGIDVERAGVLVEESREILVVLDSHRNVIMASRRARDAIDGLVEGAPLPEELLEEGHGYQPVVVPYEVGGQGEALVYFSEPGDLAAYEELRAGFTASVSHELRTPLARLLAILETAQLSSAETPALLFQAQQEVEQIRELIDDILFLSELETGKAIVSLGSTDVAPVVDDVVRNLEDSAARAGIRMTTEIETGVRMPLRARMLRMIVENLAENAIRYAGEGATLRISARRFDREVVLTAEDDGFGVAAVDLPRLFERFYRGDSARASRGTGLGLAIVKHVVTSAGGIVDAHGSRGSGLIIRCRFPAP